MAKKIITAKEGKIVFRQRKRVQIPIKQPKQPLFNEEKLRSFAIHSAN